MTGAGPSRDLRPRRLLLSATALEHARRQALAPPLSLPPGFGLVGTGSTDGAVQPLHPAVADDLRLLAAPELAVLLRAARPGLEVTACVAVAGLRGASLLRTGETLVELSAFAAPTIAHELSRVVPAQEETARPSVEEVPLDALLAGGVGTRLRSRVSGTLHATVLAGSRPDRPAAAVGSVEWVWDGAGWIVLEPLPSRGGRPWVRLVPAGPEQLPSCLAPLLAQAAA